MAVFSQNMLEMAAELALEDPTYEPLVAKFAEHFLWIAAALNRVGEGGMWDEEDGFYYDILRTPDGRSTRLKVRSLVGLLPLCATTVMPPIYGCLAWRRHFVTGCAGCPSCATRFTRPVKDTWGMTGEESRPW